MPLNNNDPRRKKEYSPAFSVQDEIKRNRKLRQTRKLKRARSTRRTLLAFVLCIAIFILAAGAILFSVMRISKITVTGNSRYSTEEIIKASALKGAILPFAGEDSAEAKIIAACPYVDDVKIVKKYPSSVELVVTEAKAIYSINVEGSMFSLDPDLRAIDSIENTDEYIFLSLPKIKSAVIGKTIEFYDETNKDYVSKLLDDLFLGEETLKFTAVDASNRFNVNAFIGDSVMVKFGGCDNIDAKIKCVKIILGSPDMAMSERTLIDVSDPGKAVLTPDYAGPFE